MTTTPDRNLSDAADPGNASSRLIGYARVSTAHQSLDLQLDALRAAGCELVFEDVVSGAKTERPGLDQMLAELRAGDTVVVWRLDRLGRSMFHVAELVSRFERDDIGLRSVDHPIDTRTAFGRFFVHQLAALAELERETIRERVQAGVDAARARGRRGGRPPVTADHPAVLGARSMADAGRSHREIGAALGVSTRTVRRYLSVRG